MQLPNLAGVATADLVEKIGTGKFSAAYINWSRTVQLLREHAPGWQPELVPAADGGILHQAPVGGYLMIRFRNGDETTPPVPQAIMDARNAAIQFDKITARDVTDTHRRGVCMAAAFTFGLAYELWAKLPLESGYHADDAQEPAPKHKPIGDNPFGELPDEEQDAVRDLAMEVIALVKDKRPNDAVAAARAQNLNNEQKIALWSLLDSGTRSAFKTAEKSPQLQSEQA